MLFYQGIRITNSTRLPRSTLVHLVTLASNRFPSEERAYLSQCSITFTSSRRAIVQSGYARVRSQHALVRLLPGSGYRWAVDSLSTAEHMYRTILHELFHLVDWTRGTQFQSHDVEWSQRSQEQRAIEFENQPLSEEEQDWIVRLALDFET